MRKLATVQRIKTVTDIPGKDRIKYASFEDIDFRVIVSSETQVGECVVYCESDTLLPERPEFEFLRSRCYNALWQGFRIRCMKMGGLFSEGICFPLSILPEGPYEIGGDVTSLLGARKYDPEVLEERNSATTTKKKGSAVRTFMYRYAFTRYILNIYMRFFPKKPAESWPNWISKTDEARAQNLQYIYERYAGRRMAYSEKIDGQSVTFALRKGKFSVYSRNLCIKNDPSNAYWATAIKFDVEKKLRKMSKILKSDLYIQGEQAGPGIQGNKLKFTERRLFIFNIRTLNGGKYLSNREISNICCVCQLETVPYFEPVNFNFKSLEELQEFARGTSVFRPDVEREGLVFRSVESAAADKDQSNMCSFKIINPDFLLKYS